MSDYNSKRIAKNTVVLYLRMAVLLVISLYTSRIIFNALGIEDYGVYNLVAGIVVFFSFLNNGLSSATKRYLTAEIGRGKEESETHIFNICVQAHVCIAILVFILAEFVGLWAIECWLNIPDSRLYAANWVYQISILITVLGIIKSPFDTIIIAYERMEIYSYMTIIDVVIKLLIVVLLQVLGGEKLIIYSLLLLGTSIVTFVITYSYCIIKIPSSKIHLVRDRNSLLNVFSFMGWSLLGQIAVVGTNQGVSVLINLYYSVVLNAALGVSNTITNIVSNFVSNFQVAFNPQIIKLYHSHDYKTLATLAIRASKLSSYLIIIFLVPICLEVKELLSFWLGDYPKYSPEFTILTLFAIFVEALSAPLWMTVYSQSNIRKYQIVISSVYSLNFFLGWLVLYLGFMPYIVIAIRICVFTTLIFIRLWFVHSLIKSFPVKIWICDVLLKSSFIIALSFIIVGLIASNLSYSGLLRLIVVTLTSIVTSGTLIIMFGFNKQERTSMLTIVKTRILKK